jgi:hypothetical protein
MTKSKHRTIANLARLWDSLNEDQRLDLIHSDNITAVEVLRLDQARELCWSRVQEE